MIFVRTKENDGDILTKNVSRETYGKQEVKFLGKMMEG
jgi:hypothetical protein